MTEQQRQRGGMGSIGLIVSRLLNDVRSLARGYVDLLRAELVSSMKALGLGIVLVLISVGLLLLAAIFLMVSAAYGLVEIGFARWAAFMTVGGAILVVIVVLCFWAVRRFKAVTLPNRTLAVLDELGKAKQRIVDNATD